MHTIAKRKATRLDDDTMLSANAGNESGRTWSRALLHSRAAAGLP